MLSVKQIENLKAKENQKRTKYHDAQGLYLVVTKSGHKSWYFVYKLPGTKNKKELSLGSLDELSLKKAREIRDEYKVLVRKGLDPKNIRDEEFSADAPTVQQFVTDFCSNKLENRTWLPKTHDKNLNRLKNHLFIHFKGVHINQITKKQVVKVFKSMSDKGLTDTAHRIKQMFIEVLRLASTEDWIDSVLRRDIEDALNDKGVVAKRPQPQSFPALTHKEDIAQFFNGCLNYSGHFLTRKLLELSANLFLRPTEIRTLRWSSVDFEQSQLVIKVAKAGFVRDHIIPLSKQSQKILLDVYKLTGSYDYVFYSSASKYMTLSENTPGQAIKRMGYKGKMTAHGFRAMVTTTIREQLKIYRNDVIEVQLSHLLASQTRRAYDRAEYLDERREMMQDWSDYLYQLIK